MTDVASSNGKVANVADLTQAFEATAATDASRLEAFRESLGKLAEEAMVSLEARARTLLAKTKDSTATLRAAAAERAAEAEELVKAKPYMAVGAAVLAGFLIGHLMSASRAQVVYLRDDR